MKKMLFIYNPKAGKAQIRNKLADILDVFTKGGYEITVYPTQRSEDAMEKTEKRSKEYDIVVCSGGDGTLDEVDRKSTRLNSSHTDSSRMPSSA